MDAVGVGNGRRIESLMKAFQLIAKVAAVLHRHPYVPHILQYILFGLVNNIHKSTIYRV